MVDPADFEQRGSHGYWYRKDRPTRGNPREWKDCKACGTRSLIGVRNGYCSLLCTARVNRQCGSVSERWLGDAVGYAGAHRRVYRTRGKASEHPCADCGKPATEWSRVHGTTGLEPEHYEPRCRGCHAAYDADAHSHVGQRNASAKLTEDDVREIRWLYATDDWLQAALAERYEVAQATISAIVRCKIWNHV